MVEEFINGLMLKLDGKIPDEYLPIIKRQLFVEVSKYELSKAKKELMTLDNNNLEILMMYLQSLKIEGRSTKTIDAYKFVLQKMVCSINKPLKEITTNDLRVYLLKLQSLNNINNRTLDNYRTYILVFFTWLVDSEYIERNPASLIRPIKYDKRTREPVNGMDMERIRNSCKNKREKAMVEFLYSTAARVGELVNAKLSDINLNTKPVSIKVFGKGSKERIVYLNDRAIFALDEYIKERGYESDYIFTNVRKPHNKLKEAAVEKIFRELGKRANISGRLYPHRIRHTTATDALDRGMPVEEVQLYLGHESIQTTMGYAEVNKDNIRSNFNKTIL